MRSNHFDSTILGIFHCSQGSIHAVEGTLRKTLRNQVAKIARRLSLRLAHWHGLSPALATCPSYRQRRQQRHQAAAVTMQGIVVDRGAVGVL
jgi:hypothetical protein